jgi:lipopolysaccharide transport system permease protein
MSIVEPPHRAIAAPSEHAAPGHSGKAPTVIRPPRGWQLLNLRELWQFRDLLYFLAWRDFKVRYKQALLGAAWAVLQPLLMMVVFTIFFGRLAGVSSGGLPYPLFAYAGLLPWFFFAGAVAAAGTSVVGSERLITKVYFPRLAVPFAAVGAGVVDFAIALGLLVVLMAWHQVVPAAAVLLLPLVFAALLLAALGVGALLAALNVRYRDFRYVIPFLLQLWMFATPAVYMQLPQGEAAPTNWVALALRLNPLTGLIDAFRACALGLPVPWLDLGVGVAASVVVFLIGCLYFRKVEDGFADVI